WMARRRDQSPQAHSFRSRTDLNKKWRSKRLHVGRVLSRRVVERHDDRSRDAARRLKSRQAVDRFTQSAAAREGGELRDDVHDPYGAAVGGTERLWWDSRWSRVDPADGG